MIWRRELDIKFFEAAVYTLQSDHRSVGKMNIK